MLTLEYMLIKCPNNLSHVFVIGETNKLKQRIQKLHSIGSFDCLEVVLVFIILNYLLISSKHILTY